MFGNFYYHGHKVQITKMFGFDGDMLVNFKVWGTGEIKQGVKIEELEDGNKQKAVVSHQGALENEIKTRISVSDDAVEVEGDSIEVEGKTTPTTVNYVFTRIKDGKEFPVNEKGLDKFVQDNQLNMDAIQLMLEGKQKTHKGFSVTVN